MAFKRAVQGNHSHQDIEYKYLHKLETKRVQGETQRHSQSIHSEQFIGRKFVG